MKLAPRLIRGPVLSVRADTPISDSVRFMRKHGVGALLITSPDSVGELVGIFTERDLLNRLELIQGTDTWTKPVRHVMTKNPHSLTLGRLHEAPALMLRLGVRHVPIVETVGGRKRAVGVVSMRDCLRFLQERGAVETAFALVPGAFTPRRNLRPLGLIANGDALTKIIAESFADDVEVQTVDPKLHSGKGTVVPDLRGYAAILIDIDGSSPTEWAKLLRRLSRPGLPPLVVCYDPSAHSAMESAILQQLRASNRIHVFTKPLPLMEFVGRLTKLLAPAEKTVSRKDLT